MQGMLSVTLPVTESVIGVCCSLDTVCRLPGQHPQLHHPRHPHLPGQVRWPDASRTECTHQQGTSLVTSSNLISWYSTGDQCPLLKAGWCCHLLPRQLSRFMTREKGLTGLSTGCVTDFYTRVCFSGRHWLNPAAVQQHLTSSPCDTIFDILQQWHI